MLAACTVSVVKKIEKLLQNTDAVDAGPNRSQEVVTSEDGQVELITNKSKRLVEVTPTGRRVAMTHSGRRLEMILRGRRMKMALTEGRVEMKLRGACVDVTLGERRVVVTLNGESMEMKSTKTSSRHGVHEASSGRAVRTSKLQNTII